MTNSFIMRRKGPLRGHLTEGFAVNSAVNDPPSSFRAIYHGDVISTAAFYLNAACLILSCNTLYGISGRWHAVLMLAVVVINALLLLFCWTKTKMESSFIRTLALWISFVTIVFSTVALVSSDAGNHYVRLTFILLGFLPALLHLLNKMNLIAQYFRPFANIMFVLAAASIVLWILGPVAGVLESDCSIETTWGGRGFAIARDGYWHLLYITQSVGFFDFVIIRNTGIFAEAPMFSYALCLSLIIEVYFTGNRRKHVIAVLVLAVITSFSMTGWMFVLFLGFVECFRLFKVNVHMRFLLIMLILATAIMLPFILELLTEKLNSNSGQVRFADYEAALSAWLSKPIAGYGFSSEALVRRALIGGDDLDGGFVNSFCTVLVSGGLLYLAIPITAFLGYLVTPNNFIACFLFFFLWGVTMVDILPITTVFLAYGIFQLLDKRCFETDALNSAAPGV